MLALGGSIGTDGILEGEIIEFNHLDELKKAKRSAIEGKIVFLNQPMDEQQINTFKAYGGCYAIRGNGAVEGSKLGAKAVIIRSLGMPIDKHPHTGSMHYEDSIAKIPAAAISTEDAEKLSLMLSKEKLEFVKSIWVVRGARGIINKTEPTDILLKAIEKIHLGELWLNRNATSRILMQIAQANAPVELSNEQKKLNTLTVKEEKVTRAIQMYPEKTLREIADKLHISEHTLRNHLASTYDKLGVRNRLELYVFCGKYQKTDNSTQHPKRRSSDD